MKFYNFIENLKSLYPETIIFVKCGAFFNVIGKDAIMAEDIFELKRTCFAKGICKCGIPVQYWQTNSEKIKNKIEEKGNSVIIINEVEDGRYEYNNKRYDIIYEYKGKYKEKSQESCEFCKRNTYKIVTNKNTIKKDDIDEIKICIEKILNVVSNLEKSVDKIE